MQFCKKKKSVSVTMLFCFNGFIYSMDIQSLSETPKYEIPSLVSLAWTACLSQDSIDGVFSRLAEKDVHLSKEELKKEIMQALQRDEKKVIYNRLPGKIKEQFSDKRDAYGEQMCVLTKDTIASDGYVIHTQQYEKQRILLEELICKCAMLKIDCSQCLHHGYSDYKITRLLLECGADPNIKNNFKITPLHRAVCDYDSLIYGQSDRFWAIRELLKHGAEVTNEMMERASSKKYHYSVDCKIPNEIHLLLLSYRWPNIFKAVVVLALIAVIYVIKRDFFKVKTF